MWDNDSCAKYDVHHFFDYVCDLFSTNLQKQKWRVKLVCRSGKNIQLSFCRQFLFLGILYFFQRRHKQGNFYSSFFFTKWLRLRLWSRLRDTGFTCTSPIVSLRISPATSWKKHMLSKTLTEHVLCMAIESFGLYFWRKKCFPLHFGDSDCCIDLISMPP